MRQLVCDGEPPPCSVGRRSDEDLGRKAVRLQPAVLDEVRVRDTGHAEFLSEALYRDGDAARFWVLASHDACGVLSQCAHGPVSYTHLEPTRRTPISYAVFCLKKKKKKQTKT